MMSGTSERLREVVELPPGIGVVLLSQEADVVFGAREPVTSQLLKAGAIAVMLAV
jgi:hypothetical protein